MARESTGEESNLISQLLLDTLEPRVAENINMHSNRIRTPVTIARKGGASTPFLFQAPPD